MWTIKVFDIEGLKKSKDGYLTKIYTFEEMINTENYDLECLEDDRDIEQRDFPVGWVIKEMGRNGLIFIPVYEYEKFEMCEASPSEIESMRLDLPHSGILN